MRYIRLDTLQTSNPRTDFPGTSFPRDWAGGEVGEITYTRVLPTETPEYDSMCHIIAEGEPQLVDGEYRQSWTLTERPIEDVRADLHQMRRDARTEAELAGFAFSGHPIDSGRDSILRITQVAFGAAMAVQTGDAFDVTWSCADGSELALDALGVIGMQQALAAHGAACHARSQSLKAEIDAAATVADLGAIDIGAGWPG